MNDGLSLNFDSSNQSCGFASDLLTMINDDNEYLTSQCQSTGHDPIHGSLHAADNRRRCHLPRKAFLPDQGAATMGQNKCLGSEWHSAI
jgi:hypothetical protein